jgi:hypothetical protein
MPTHQETAEYVQQETRLPPDHKVFKNQQCTKCVELEFDVRRVLASLHESEANRV